jgi:hypothetical protein
LRKVAGKPGGAKTIAIAGKYVPPLSGPRQAKQFFLEKEVFLLGPLS